MRFEAAKLLAFVERTVGTLGVSQADATIVAASLVDAELTGQSGHGMVRLPLLIRR